MQKLLTKVLLLGLIAVLSGCSTYQYSARQVNVNRKDIATKYQAAEIVVDYSRTVTATSDYSMTRKDAIEEAEQACILREKIDVVVDPIFKLEFAPFKFKKKWKATVTGYAGTYKAAPAGVDAVKDYKMEDIEKYKLLTDPDFPKYYYNKEGGDSYFFNSAGAPAASKGASASLAVAPKLKKLFTPKNIKWDFDKSKKLRNAGIGLVCAGAVSTLLIGAPCLTSADSVSDEYYEYGYSYEYDSFNEAAHGAGVAFTTIGMLSAIAGVPMWIVGSTRMKKSDRNISASIGTTRNGAGLRLTF